LEKLYQVFISSTYSDLTAERRSVRDAVAKAGHIPAGMELFPASSQQQFEYIKRIIDRCDYYVLVIAGRYGTLADADISYTEMEYRYAVDKGLPILVFLHGEPNKIEVGKTDETAELSKKLEGFRNAVSSNRLVAFWTNPDDLATQVTVALSHEINLNPGLGWIRGDKSFDPEIYKENEKNRQKVEELMIELQSYRDGDKFLKFPTDIEDIDENIEFSYSLFASDTMKNFDEKIVLDMKCSVQISWRNMFLLMSEDIKLNRQEDVIIENFATRISESEDIEWRQSYKDSDIKVEPTVSYDTIRYQFEALGLIITEVQKSKVINGESSPLFLANWVVNSLLWRLTEKGTNFLAWSNARKVTLPSREVQ
jgi:Domain of unknown function (DUF4062)